MDLAEHSMWWYRALHARLFEAIAHVSGRILDAGCGTGGFLSAVRDRRPDLEAFGLERNEGAARRAAEKSGAPIVLGTVNCVPIATSSFDAIVSADVLCHNAVNPMEALGEFARLLRTDGLLVLNLPAHEWLRSAHDQRVGTARRVNSQEIASMLLNAGFGHVHVQYWNSLLLPLMILRRKVLARNSPTSDVMLLPRWLDIALYAVTALERRLPVRSPVGGSVLSTACRIGR